MKTLALVRHAKSDWGDPGLADHDRPLNERGIADAPRMAERLAASGFAPDVLLSSTAVRARTTAEAFGRRLQTAVSLRDQLYGAAPAEILREVAAQPQADTVLVVAHDPGLSILAGTFAPAIGHMPTCAVAVFRWDVDDWVYIDALPPQDWSFDTPR